MILRGIDFGPAWLGSGAGGFFGEGYWFHPVYQAMFPSGFCPEKFTLAGKTMVFGSRMGIKYGEKGNTELCEDTFALKECFPDSIICGPMELFRGEMYNAVGLAGVLERRN